MTPAVGGRSGWLTTLRQALPRLFEILPRLRPTFEAVSVAELDPTILVRHGIRGVIWDVDGTLMAHHAKALDPSIEGAFGALTQSVELRHAILSNSSEARFLELGRIFPQIAVLRAYSTPNGSVGRKLLQGHDSFEGSSPIDSSGEVEALRKPSATLVEGALLELGCSPEGAVMIGDQLFTDIAGANLGGIRSIKVPTLARASFPFPVRLAQVIETVLYRVLHRGYRPAKL